MLKYENVDTFPDVVWYRGEGWSLTEDGQSAGGGRSVVLRGHPTLVLTLVLLLHLPDGEDSLLHGQPRPLRHPDGAGVLQPGSSEALAESRVNIHLNITEVRAWRKLCQWRQQLDSFYCS